MSFSGADIGEVLALAGRFERQASRLHEIATSSTIAIQTAQWSGGNIDQVRAEWNRSARPRIVSLAQECARLATDLRKQAEQQRATSAGGSVLNPGSAIPFPVTPADLEDFVAAIFGTVPEGIDELLERIRDASGNLLLGVGVAGTLLEILKDVDLPTLEKVLGPVGFLLDAGKFAGQVEREDYFGALRNFLSTSVDGAAWVGKVGLVKGASGAALGSLGPLALGIKALDVFIDWTLPTTPEQQDSTIQKGAERLFGPGVDANELSPEQAQRLAKRYDGAWGVATMISDTMDATADRIFPWNW